MIAAGAGFDDEKLGHDYSFLENRPAEPETGHRLAEWMAWK
jgi:hypothetical protein